MTRRDFTDNQLKAHVLDFLRRQERWGGRYFPLDTLVNWVGKGMMRNGKRVRENVKKLVRDRYVLVWKGGDTVSLNPHMAKEINEFIEKNLG
jgi:hypothetical protein